MLGFKTKPSLKKIKTPDTSETVGEVLRGVTTASKFSADVADETVKGLWDQLLGKHDFEVKHTASHGDMAAGQEINFKGHTTEHKAKAHKEVTDFGHEYKREITQGESRISRQDQEVQMQVEEILIELKQLINTSEQLSKQYRNIAVAQRPMKAGKYHVSFFSWMIKMIQTARLTLEDSGNWLQAMGSKKRKQNYWGMFKKHGTSFGLSNERSVATQVG